MHTIGKLAKRFGLSRSTLLHYEKLGLLNPAGRSSGDYRLYDDVDVARLELIVALREAGLSLKQIGEVVHQDEDSTLRAALEERLRSIHQQIGALRQQQKRAAALLAQLGAHPGERVINVESWVSFLRAAGLDEAAMWTWHAAFERDAPEAHGDFLASLGIDPKRAEEIRQRSRALLQPSPGGDS
ncbi:MerR family transcriptional regulator [Magnetofaba australis]|uniref:Putative transcriptional regulator n=1 Tax=Magnetofaba australis IT-1 TaxID=1434232 RepID=A0A1Y2K0K6_9PROT|nr:MerR family transcriptional regulator [Magnetofaba australis]OSM01492.1 putative transcriptional regulator [Magnetofaba australis IT-1]